MTIDNKKSLNSQLYDAVAAIAVASDNLRVAQSRVSDARREECNSINKLNEAQKHFDELVNLVKKNATKGSDWANVKLC
jgi:predicted kinase